MRYKLWAAKTDSPWIPEEGLEVLKRDENGDPMIPSGKPDLVQPEFEPEKLDLLEKSIEKTTQYLTVAQQLSWEQLLLKLKEPDCYYQETPVWPVAIWKTYEEVLPASPATTDEDLAALTCLLQKERQCAEVI